MRRTFHYSWGHQVHFWSCDWAFFDRSANIFEMVPDKHVTLQLFIDRNMHLSFGTMTFDLG